MVASLSASSRASPPVHLITTSDKVYLIHQNSLPITSFVQAAGGSPDLPIVEIGGDGFFFSLDCFDAFSDVYEFLEFVEAQHFKQLPRW